MTQAGIRRNRFFWNMMQDDFFDHLGGLVGHLLSLANEDPELRRLLLATSRALVVNLEAVEAEQRAADASSLSTPAEPVKPPEWLAPERLDQLRAELTESAFRGGEAPQQVMETAPGPAWQDKPVANEELGLVAARCWLKAEASRWALERVERIERGADREVEVFPIDQNMIRRAKELPDCFLWMNHPSGPSPSLQEALDWDLLAEAFDNTARAAALLQELVTHQDEASGHFENALELAAEAQSALRVAAREVGFDDDPDQAKLFRWLRRIGYENQFYFHRYMRVTDEANHGDFTGLQRRIDALDEAFQAQRNQVKQRKQLLSRARYHAKRIERAPQEGHEDDWEKVIVCCEELLETGMAPSNVEIRNILLPVFDDVPDLGEEHPGFQLILRELDAYASLNAPAQGYRTEAAPSDAVVRAAELVQDTAMVMIGGDPRTDSKRSLEEAFRLSELVWVTSNKHQSTVSFEPYVARPDVSVVLLAIRWSSHSFGDVKAYCDRYGKALVRLPAGYGVNQVASQILEQASHQLGKPAN
jgi:hypothetical protein